MLQGSGIGRIGNFQLRATQGNTILEYVLIGVLILGISLVALISFSGALSGRVGSVKADMQSRIDGTLVAKKQRLAALAMQANESSQSAYDALNAEGSGQAVTTGANGDRVLGSSKQSSDSIEGAVADLPPEEQALVKEVANTAYNVAKLQRALEQLSAYSKGNMDLFRQMQVMVDGKLMTSAQIAEALGEGGLVNELNAKKDQVLASGITSDVKDKVASLSSDVTTDAVVTSSKTNEVLATNANPVAVAEVTDADATDVKATTICTTGGNQSTGTACTN